jgi:hypothetical protein
MDNSGKIRVGPGKERFGERTYWHCLRRRMRNKHLPSQLSGVFEGPNRGMRRALFLVARRSALQVWCSSAPASPQPRYASQQNH